MKFLALILVCGIAWGEETLHAARERTYHVLHYRLALSIDPARKFCSGTATIDLVPLRPALEELRLDAAELNIKSVALGHKELSFHSVAESLIVDLDKPYGLNDTLAISVSYSVASPRKGLYFTAPDSGYPGKQLQAWTQGEPDDNHFWFPCYDFPNDKATSEVIVTVRDSFTVISNGRLVDVARDSKKHTATFHWLESKPHVSYLTSLVIGEYVEVKDSWESVPLSYYVYPNQKGNALRSFSKTSKIMEFYSTKIGFPYPWEKYAQTVVQDFIWGGEENVSATTLADGTIHDSRAHLDYSSENLVAHELAHMWWGDLVTCRDWSHSWLNEGFATFFQNQFTEFDLGHDDAAKEIMDNQNSVRNADVGDRRRPTVCNRFVNPNDLFDNRIYGKGAVVLSMLKNYLGDELFWKSIRSYAQKFAFQNAETNDFKIAIEEATGYNLSWFFEQWLYKPGYPEFDVSSSWDQPSRTLNLRVRQVQKIDSATGLFKTPAEIELWVHGEPQVFRIWLSQQEEMFSFPAYQQPELVIFDPGSRILKKVTFHKSIDEWVFQLRHAREAVDRILAVDELAWVADSGEVNDALKKSALEDPFWDVRRDAVFALGDARRSHPTETLISAYGDRDARVRTAAITALGNYEGTSVVSTLRHAFDEDSSYAVASAALRSLARADSVNAKSYCARALERTSRNEVIRSSALKVLSQIGDQDALRMIMSNTRYGVDRNIRIECVNILASKWKSRDDAFSLILSLLSDPSFHLRRAVINALGNTRDARALAPLRACMARESDTRVVKDVRDAIDRIQQSQSGLSH